MPVPLGIFGIYTIYYWEIVFFLDPINALPSDVTRANHSDNTKANHSDNTKVDHSDIIEVGSEHWQGPQAVHCRPHPMPGGVFRTGNIFSLHPW